MVSLPEWATGLRLCKIVNGDLHMSEEVQFLHGWSGVDTVLRRAAISGVVGPLGETGDFWADLLNSNGDWDETIALDRDAWNSLKNRWMRCRMVGAEQ